MACGAILVLLCLNGTLDFGYMVVYTTAFKTNGQNIKSHFLKFIVSVNLNDAKSPSVVTLVNILELVYN